MSCGCGSNYPDDGDGDYCDIWEEGRVQKSRKAFTCYECGDKIPAGSRYCWAKNLYDGLWTTYRRCLSCSALAELVTMESGYCPLWGDLHSTAQQMLGDGFLSSWEPGLSTTVDKRK